jgi:hypothetical protein
MAGVILLLKDHVLPALTDRLAASAHAAELAATLHSLSSAHCQPAAPR